MIRTAGLLELEQATDTDGCVGLSSSEDTVAGESVLLGGHSGHEGLSYSENTVSWMGLSYWEDTGGYVLLWEQHQGLGLYIWKRILSLAALPTAPAPCVLHVYLERRLYHQSLPKQITCEKIHHILVVST